jgi:hypothetical protein
MVFIEIYQIENKEFQKILYTFMHSTGFLVLLVEIAGIYPLNSALKSCSFAFCLPLAFVEDIPVLFDS